MIEAPITESTPVTLGVVATAALTFVGAIVALVNLRRDVRDNRKETMALRREIREQLVSKAAWQLWVERFRNRNATTINVPDAPE